MSVPGRVAGLGAALIATLVLARTGDAFAHPLTKTVMIPVDRAATIRLDVPAEGRSAMVGIDVELPATFRLDRPGEPTGWTASVEGDVIRYRGPQVPIGTAASFDITGTATEKGKLTIPVVTIAADGTTTEWRGGEFPPVEVYAGVSPAEATGEPVGDGGSFGTLAAVGAVGAFLAVGAVVALRRRRAV